MSRKGNRKSSKTKTSVPLNSSVNKEAVVENNEEINQEDIWQKFELELKWCTEQLEAQLQKNSRQSEETAKLLRMLLSSKVPLIKKRQIMRSAFGDYRQKMKEEEIKLRKDMKAIQFTEVKIAKHKGTFLKKSPKQLQLNSQNEQVSPSAKQLQLNTQNEHVSQNQQPTTEVPKDPYVFLKSDNSFRFNFSNLAAGEPI